MLSTGAMVLTVAEALVQRLKLLVAMLLMPPTFAEVLSAVMR